MNNEKITQHNKRNHTHRIMSFAVSICMACICFIHPSIAYANPTEVEIVSPQSHGWYEVYDSNGNVVNSYVQGTSTGYFVNSWNTLAKNIARITSTVFNSNQVTSSINNLLNSTNSILNTVSTNIGYINSHISLIQDQMSSYFGANSSSYPNNIYGKLDYIQTYTYQSVQRLDQIKTILNNGITANEDETINWIVSNSSWLGYSNTVNGTYTLPDSNVNVSSNNTRYFAYSSPFTTSINTNFIKVQIPIKPATANLNNFIKSIHIYNNSFVDITNYCFLEYDNINDCFNLYCYLYTNGNQSSHKIYIGIENMNAYNIMPSLPSSIYYLEMDTEDYYTVAENILLRKNIDKQDEIVSAIESNAFDDQDIIDAINSLSLVDNDVKIEVNYTHNDALDVTSAIQYITSFFKGNGVSLTDFTTQSNTSQNEWLSQTNQDLLGTSTGGYVNLYE